MDNQYHHHHHSLAPVSYPSRMPTSLTRSGMTAGGLKTMFQITIPLNDIPPPFKDTDVNKSFELLQNTSVCRDGGEYCSLTCTGRQGSFLAFHFTSSHNSITEHRCGPTLRLRKHLFPSTRACADASAYAGARDGGRSGETQATSTTATATRHCPEVA